MSQAGENRKEKEKKSSSSSSKDKDKDGKLLAEMAKEPATVNQDVIELVNRLGGRQAEVLRKEFSQGQATMSAEVKNLALVMTTIAKTLEGLKEPPSIPGWSLFSI